MTKSPHSKRDLGKRCQPPTHALTLRAWKLPTRLGKRAELCLISWKRKLKDTARGAGPRREHGAYSVALRSLAQLALPSLASSQHDDFRRTSLATDGRPLGTHSIRDQAAMAVSSAPGSRNVPTGLSAQNYWVRIPRDISKARLYQILDREGITPKARRPRRRTLADSVTFSRSGSPESDARLMVERARLALDSLLYEVTQLQQQLAKYQERYGPLDS